MYYDVIIIHPRLGRCTSGFAVGLRLVDQRSLVECFGDVMAHHARYSAQLNDTIFAIPQQCLANMHGLPALARPAGLPALCMRNIVFVWGRALVIGGVCHRIGAKTPCGFAKSTHRHNTNRCRPSRLLRLWCHTDPLPQPSRLRRARSSITLEHTSYGFDLPVKLRNLATNESFPVVLPTTRQLPTQWTGHVRKGCIYAIWARGQNARKSRGERNQYIYNQTTQKKHRIAKLDQQKCPAWGQDDDEASLQQGPFVSQS